VRTVAIAFVQGLFNGAPTGCYHWEPDDEKTEIIIRDENPIHVDKYGMRPCINFTHGTAEFYHVGMDDLHDFNFANGKKTKGLLVPGTITANVCSRSDIEAHNLAWVVAEHVWLLREILIAQGFFEIGRGMRVTPPHHQGLSSPVTRRTSGMLAPSLSRGSSHVRVRSLRWGSRSSRTSASSSTLLHRGEWSRWAGGRTTSSTSCPCRYKSVRQSLLPPVHLMRAVVHQTQPGSKVIRYPKFHTLSIRQRPWWSESCERTGPDFGARRGEERLLFP